MGTPRTNKRTHAHSVPVEAPSIAETLESLTLGYQIKPFAHARNIHLILNSMGMIFLPMVPFLEKPIGEFGGSFRKIAIENKHERVMLVHDGFGDGSFSVGLHRSGDWFVDAWSEGDDVSAMRMKSRGLVAVVLEWIERKILPHFPAETLWAEEDVDFLKDIFRFAMLLEFVAKCQKTVDKTVQEREERIRALRARVDLMEQLGGALDPLTSGRKIVKLSMYSIFRETSSGVSRETDDYLTADALHDFWNVIKPESKGEFTPGPKQTFYPFISELQLRSLDQFVDRIGMIRREISKTQERIRSGTQSRGSRLALRADEVDILRAIVNYLFA